MCQPQKPPLPSISGFPPNYDPMRLNWQSSFTPSTQQYGFAQPSQPVVSQYGAAFPSQPSTPAPALPASTIPTADLHKYMFPVDPNNTNQTVIGVYTRGKNTKPKDSLPAVYKDAGVPLCCHSCGNSIRYIAPNLPSMIGDHQPPTVLFEYLTNYSKLAQGIWGKYGMAAFEIQNSKLTLYVFQYNGIKYQTNNCNVAASLSHQQPTAVQYSQCSEQYLYPHCEACSNRQGRLLL